MILYTDNPFSDSFCKNEVADFLQTIAASGSCNLVAMPGVGVTFFLKQLLHTSHDEFVSVNSYEMHEFSKAAFYNQLARKLGLQAAPSDHVDLGAISDELKRRAVGHKKVVLIFNRFDRLGPILDQGFYENLSFLQDASGQSLVMLFVTAEPILEMAGQGMQDLLRLLGATKYFPGYSVDDLREIMANSGVTEIEQQALELCGGHHALLQILMRCQNLDNALSDPMVELLVKDIYTGLNPKRRKAVDTAAAGHGSLRADPFLYGAGYLVKRGEKDKVFTPLLAEYSARQSKEHLPVKERRLLGILKRNAGRVVSKQDIFDAVWRESDGIASDWALNALVYRLRRHAAFNNQRYTIESQKKQGFVLHDHQA